MQPKIIRLFLRDLYKKITFMTYNYFETILSNENQKIDISSIQQIKNYVLIMNLILLYFSTAIKSLCYVAKLWTA